MHRNVWMTAAAVCLATAGIAAQKDAKDATPITVTGCLEPGTENTINSQNGPGYKLTHVMMPEPTPAKVTGSSPAGPDADLKRHPGYTPAIRGTIRPFATQAPLLRGLRVTGFYFGDNYIKDSERTRAVAQVTYESTYINAGYDYIDAHDQTAIAARDVEAKGYGIWATPRIPLMNGASFEALLRYDHLNPDAATSESRPRTIIGFAYWFPHQGNVSSALMLDFDGQTFNNFPTFQPAQNKIAVHGLVNF